MLYFSWIAIVKFKYLTDSKLVLNFFYFFQESAYYVPLTFNTGSGEVTAYNVSGLSPDTRYTIQVAALTRRGDGTRSQPVKIKTPGGVPSRPNITPRLINPIENRYVFKKKKKKNYFAQRKFGNFRF